jgi:phosphoenolpyruvate carboxykinase (GTP)
MGPVDSPMSQIGVQLTDSAYVVVNMRIMARIGLPVFKVIDKDEKRVVPCMHSLGAPLEPGQGRAVAVQRQKYIVHFPETREIWSYGSGYGGNALLGKKCFALRIASVPWPATRAGWPSTCSSSSSPPERREDYVTAAFPSACGKTNLAMLIPTDPSGWKVETVGDDIAWMRPGDERPPLRHQPRGRLLRRRAGTSAKTNPNAMATSHGTRSSPTWPSPTTAASGGRA